MSRGVEVESSGIMLGFVAFAVMLLVMALVASALWPILTGNAPWEPMPPRTIRQMLTLADLQPGETLYDLGSGDGRALIIAAREFGALAVGIEIDPLRVLWSRALIAVLGLRNKVRVLRGSIEDYNLSRADVVLSFLTLQTNQRLEDKLRRELCPTARVVSREFPFPGWTPATHDSDSKLYVYHITQS